MQNNFHIGYFFCFLRLYYSPKLNGGCEQCPDFSNIFDRWDFDRSFSTWTAILTLQCQRTPQLSWNMRMSNSKWENEQKQQQTLSDLVDGFYTWFSALQFKGCLLPRFRVSELRIKHHKGCKSFLIHSHNC